VTQPQISTFAVLLLTDNKKFNVSKADKDLLPDAMQQITH